MAEVRSAAPQKTPGGCAYKIEGMVKDGQGGELPLPVSDEGELETYLHHVDGSGGADVLREDRAGGMIVGRSRREGCLV